MSKGFHPKTEFKKGHTIRLGKYTSRKYVPMHQWIVRVKGIPIACETCGVKNLKRKDGGRAIHWANISGEYERDVNDWAALCTPCHREFDDM